ncbi:MAG TPA: hypothetical protein VLL76_01040 [Candidatus Omnitrophota bacterium]|nr:hypothetical protein [Candidatus Omnitrophota bacterium]
MAEARSQAAWEHTSALLAFLAEPHRDRRRRGRPYRPSDFNPHLRRDIVITKANSHLLAQAFGETENGGSGKR